MCSKLAIITGATSGLGKAFAYHLAREGWHLILTGRRMNCLRSIQSDLEIRFMVRVRVYGVDFFNSEELNEFTQYISQLPRIDMLINNAGFGNRKDFYEESFADQNKMLKVHITATSQIIHEVVPVMKRQNNGIIINVSSLCAYLPAPLSYFYCASKAFIVSLSECMHIDLKRFNIKVQALCPGFIKTEFHKRMGLCTHNSWLEEKILYMDKRAVVNTSLKMLSSSRVICIPGLVNKFIYQIAQVLPKTLYYKLTTLQTNKYKNRELLST
ncbi:SDR family NAD(P)-dependent oxidoreductase [Carboxylicivirga sp. RSCT41]|uniref:SDR family NAD(P)-dependent oxidoreductase n=1 Tax=Carboxylicivirga agarovorans TaxID=3417570 RepID=UPI003D3550A7